MYFIVLIFKENVCIKYLKYTKLRKIILFVLIFIQAIFYYYFISSLYISSQPYF
jgi:hypothetical protein